MRLRRVIAALAASAAVAIAGVGPLAPQARAQDGVTAVTVEPPSSTTTTTTIPVPEWPPASWGDGVVGLTFTRRDGYSVEAPRIATDVEASVNGPIGRVRFTQRYTNPSRLWVNGNFAFQVPQEATIDTMRLLVGDRAFQSQIYTEKDGQRIYAATAKAGTAVAKLDGGWDGRWFFGAVANIGPGETVVVEIEYTQQLRSFGDEWQLSIPTALATTDVPSNVWFDSESSKATPATIPTRRPDGQSRNPLHAVIDVNAGVAIDDVRASGAGHRVDQRANGFTLTVPLQDASIDQDLTVVWKARPSSTVQADAALEHTATRGDYAAVLLTPPVGSPATGGRDVVFVVPPLGFYEEDTYRSMFESVMGAINALGSSDRFNLITGDTSAAFGELVPATSQTKLAALAYADRRIDRLFTDDGDFDWERWSAEWDDAAMSTMLERAMRVDGTQERPLDVVMVNDGSEEWTSGDILVTLSTKRLQHQRVHMLVVEDDPNYQLIDAITRAGGGSYVLADTASAALPALTRFIGSLGAPVVRDLSVGPKGGPKVTNAELLPGHQVAQVFKLPAGVDTIEADGIINGSPWHWERKLDVTRSTPGVERIWAARSIFDLEVLEDIEWTTRLAAEWQAFYVRFEKEIGRSYFDEWYAQWKRAYEAAPKDANGFLLDYEAFWDSFRFVSPLPEPKPSRDWERERERLALDHSIIARGLTMLVAVDPLGPRREGDVVKPTSDVLAALPPTWHLGSVFGPEQGAFAQRYDDASVRDAFTLSLRGTPRPRSAYESDDAAARAAAAPATPSFTGSNAAGLGALGLVLVLLGVMLVGVSRRRLRPGAR